MNNLLEPSRPIHDRHPAHGSGTSRSGASLAGAGPVGRTRRTGAVIAAAAVVLALWTGLTAPAVSPVAGPVPVGTAAPAAVTQDDPAAAADDPQPAPDPQLVPDGRGRRGRR